MKTVLVLAVIIGVMGWQAADPAPAVAATVNVSVDDDFFSPSTLTVTVGDTVQWTWEGSNQHTVTASGGEFDSPLQTSGTFSHTFNAEGSFDYICGVHGASMSGTVIVQQAATATATSAAATSTATTAIDATATRTRTSTPATGTVAPAATATPVPPGSTPTAVTADRISAPATSPGPGTGAAQPSQALPRAGTGDAGGGIDTRLLALASAIAAMGAAAGGAAVRRLMR